MSPETCHRVRDALSAGNVWGDASLLEHAKACEVCSSELAVLKKRREFRDAFPVLSSIADESKRAPTRTPAHPQANLAASRRHLFVMIAALVVIILYVTRSGPFRPPSMPREGDEAGPNDPPKFQVSNLENALFESKVEGGTVRTTLTRGVAAFHVEPLRARQRFFVSLPDGELEVRGTRFVAAIERDKTQVVDVAEGAVALRLHGRAEMFLTAGQRWPAVSDRPTVTFMRQVPRKDAAAPDPANPSD
jgi:hypothetical protein